MRLYVSFLRAHPIIAQLAAVQTLSYFGAWFTNVAVYALAIEWGVSPFWIGVIAVVQLLPAVLQAPFSGPLIDRLAPRRLMSLMLLIEIAATLGLLLVSFAAWLWLLLVLLFVRMSAGSFYFTAEMTLLPRLIDGEALQRANELHSIVWSLSYTLGMAASGVVVYWWGAKTAIALDAVLFMVAFVLFRRAALPVLGGKSSEPLGEMIRKGWRYLAGHRHLIGYMLLHATVGLTAYDALVAILAKEYYAAVVAIPLAIGSIHAVRAVALMIGPVVLGRLMSRARLTWILAAQGAVIALWALWQDVFWLSLLGSLMAGFFTSTLWSYTYTLLQESTDPRYIGRVIAYNDMLFMSVAALFSMVVGAMVETGWAPQSMTLVIATGFFVAALLYGLSQISKKTI